MKRFCAKPKLEQYSTPEIDLILETPEVLARVEIQRGGYRVEYAQADVRLIIEVDQEVAEQNVGRRQVDLSVQRVAARQTAAVILP